MILALPDRGDQQGPGLPRADGRPAERASRRQAGGAGARGPPLPLPSGMTPWALQGASQTNTGGLGLQRSPTVGQGFQAFRVSRAHIGLSSQGFAPSCGQAPKLTPLGNPLPPCPQPLVSAYPSLAHLSSFDCGHQPLDAHRRPAQPFLLSWTFHFAPDSRAGCRRGDWSLAPGSLPECPPGVWPQGQAEAGELHHLLVTGDCPRLPAGADPRPPGLLGAGLLELGLSPTLSIPHGRV